MASYRRVVLVGLSGTGKSTLARLLADRLGWRAVDTDLDVEAALGKSIPEIFEDDGEPAFRAAERAALTAALKREDVVVATGGGAVVDEAVWTPELLRRPDTLTVALDAPVETLHARLVAHAAAAGDAATRPMLSGDDPMARMRAMRDARNAAYARASIALDVSHAPPDTIATELASLMGRAHPTDPDVVVDLPTVRSEIHIRPGAVDAAAELIAASWPTARRLWLVTDENVDRAHGDRVASTLAATGATVHRRTVSPGESSKSWSVAGDVVGWLVESGLQRSDVVVALGGGVVGDLAGFAAAVALRGVGLVQIPTSLLAMVDSSVGGKTGVNLPAGKNLAGAFYQPPLVIIDPTFLVTLPQRELATGWAEVVKHAIIQPSTPGGSRADLLRLLERNGDALRTLAEPATTHLIRRNVALKAAVVEADEREAGLRAILNYGHTIGHAVEAADYRYLHGEAIAVGMRAAGWLALRLDRVDASTVERHDALIDAFSLPRTAHADPDVVAAKLRTDKKKSAGAQQWILADRSGGVSVTTDVPANLVDEAIRRVTVGEEPAR